MIRNFDVEVDDIATDILLHECVLGINNYTKIASTLGLSRTRFYKWFHDVFTNKVSEQLTKDDKKIIELNVKRACRLSLFMDTEFQYTMRDMLSKEYYVNIFTVFFNNC